MPQLFGQLQSLPQRRSTSLKALVLGGLLALSTLSAQATEAADTREWHALQRSELDYAARAPYHLDNELLIEASPDAVFKVLSESDWVNWFVDFRSVSWTSEPPYRVGSTRTVQMKDLAVKERFLAWDPGKRFSFSIDAISNPMVEAMMEDLQLEPVDKGRATRLHWRVYYTPTALIAVLHPIFQGIFGGMFKQSLDNLKAYVEKQAQKPL
jgi:hypothetical protein